MSLTGTFDCLDLEAALALLARRKATGHLHLRVAKTSGVILLQDGRVVGAEVADGPGRHLTTDWREQAKELCCRALRDRRGRFEFVPAAAVEPTSGESMIADHLARAARHRAEQWAEVEGVIPSGDAVLRLSDALPLEQVTIHREQWPVLRAVDGRRPVSLVARRLGVDLLRCCQLLKPLVEIGAVALAPEPERIGFRAAPGGPGPVDGGRGEDDDAVPVVDGAPARPEGDRPRPGGLRSAVRILGPAPSVPAG
jgi:hypothetical protein